MISSAIESVINQSFTNWELIVVDDGSTDNTKELIVSYIKVSKKIKSIEPKISCSNKKKLKKIFFIFKKIKELKY